ncbi:RidA family protein [Streptomyces malaysiensis]|uniref:Endoribonuclease L-PSP n=1 Tax=Streptomyces malaysiensis TaxID=92644 RepID=A0A7X5XA39_STRMQ|nr:RidA family protein [Streptomyces malaysiensis]NIY69402.1 endoribonuclease L-PSP [Streptomyces malaysiensis]
MTAAARTDPHKPEPEPDAPVPMGDYAAARLVGDLVFTAGMTPRAGGVMLTASVLGAGLDIADAAELAGVAAGRAVEAGRAVAEAAGRRLESAVSMTVYLAAAPGFSEHSRVADGATARLRAVLPGPPPARAAVGVAGLPSGAPVEVALVLSSTAVPTGDVVG